MFQPQNWRESLNAVLGEVKREADIQRYLDKKRQSEDGSYVSVRGPTQPVDATRLSSSRGVVESDLLAN